MFVSLDSTKESDNLIRLNFWLHAVLGGLAKIFVNLKLKLVIYVR